MISEKEFYCWTNKIIFVLTVQYLLVHIYRVSMLLLFYDFENDYCIEENYNQIRQIGEHYECKL